MRERAHPHFEGHRVYHKSMWILFVVLLVLAVLAFGTGILAHALGFLLWVALGLAIVAVIVWLVRFISSR